MDIGIRGARIRWSLRVMSGSRTGDIEILVRNSNDLWFSSIAW